MSSRPASICLICALRKVIRPHSSPSPLWQQSARWATQLHRKRPSRMTLSPSVAKPPSRHREPTEKRRREVEGPFAAINRTTVGPRFEEDLKRMRSRGSVTARSSKHIFSTRQNVDRAKDPQISEKAPPRAAREFLDKRKKSKTNRDMKALQMQRALAQIGYAERTKVKKSIEDINSFDEFPLSPRILESIPTQALDGMINISPTPIQRLAIPSLVGLNSGSDISKSDSQKMKQFLLAAETGSGKTLAYLLPTIDAVKRADVEEAESEVSEEETEIPETKRGVLELEPPPVSNSPHYTSGRPKAIVLVPTSELVEQTGKLFKAFSHTVKLRVALLSAAYSATVIRNRLFGPQGTDIVVSTPHLLKSISESEPNVLSRVTHLIVDEADSLFDRSFTPLTTAILDRAIPSLKQLILCSATIPRSLDSFLEKRFPNIQRLATPNLHAIPRRVKMSVVEVDHEPYRGNRDLACADSIWQIGRSVMDADSRAQSDRDSKRIIVFVNEREKASELAKYLSTKGIDAVALNRDTVDERKAEILDAFTTAKNSLTSKAEVFDGDEPLSSTDGIQSPSQVLRTLKNVKVLVMTDIGSRGIDTIAVRNVILYDVPHTTIDFIHRLGRVGRMGRRGRGFVLVGKHDRRDIVREVREGMFKGQALI